MKAILGFFRRNSASCERNKVTETNYLPDTGALSFNPLFDCSRKLFAALNSGLWGVAIRGCKPSYRSPAWVLADVWKLAPTQKRTQSSEVSPCSVCILEPTAPERLCKHWSRYSKLALKSATANPRWPRRCTCDSSGTPVIKNYQLIPCLASSSFCECRCGRWIHLQTPHGCPICWGREESSTSTCFEAGFQHLDAFLSV